jgi:hypothetical protein
MLRSNAFVPLGQQGTINLLNRNRLPKTVAEDDAWFGLHISPPSLMDCFGLQALGGKMILLLRGKSKALHEELTLNPGRRQLRTNRRVLVNAL